MSENTKNEAGNKGGSVTVALPRGFTYFVRDGNMIKIGSSMRPADRISALQTGSSRALETLAIVPIEIADEFQTHRLFAHLRERGEWFRAETDLLDFIAALPAASPEPPPAPAPVNVKAPEKPPITLRSMAKHLARIRPSLPPKQRAIASNLIGQIRNMETYVQPDWVTHESQTLPWLIAQ